MNIHSELTLWNAFHDGIVTEIDDSVTGEVRITVDLEYVRNQFSPAG